MTETTAKQTATTEPATSVEGGAHPPAVAEGACPSRKVIEPPSGWPSLNLGELWRYRDLLLMLVWRDFSANYRQSVIGYGWALFRPVLTVAVFSLVFGLVAKFPSDGLPYPLFCLAGLLPWLYFAGCLTGASNSVVNNSHLLTKVYFPRLILPMASVAGGLIDFAIQFVVLGGLMAWFGVVPTWTILLAPAFLLLCVLAALAVGLWLTALNVKFRDIGYTVPFLVQMWLWLTPIAYPSSLIPERWRPLFGLNPMTGVVEGFRWAMFDTAAPDWGMMGVSFAVVVVLFASGLYYFRKSERTFADLI